MRNSNTTDKAYAALRTYVTKRSFLDTFDANLLRAKLTTVKGVKPNQIGGLISTAVRRGLISKIGETVSNNRTHKSGKVGIYARA